MTRILLLVRIFLLMLPFAMIWASCSKQSQAGSGEVVQRRLPLMSVDSTSIGSIVISKEPGGEARVVVAVDRSVIADNPAPLRPMLTNSEPLAFLNFINIENGVSETQPIVSANKGLTISYDALMFTRAVRLVLMDGENNIIADTQIH